MEAQNLWSWQNPIPQGNGLSDICFIDSLRGWCVGKAGTVLRTTDGGEQWQYTQASIHEHLIRVSFVSSMLGWTMTNNPNKVLRTTDGGITWDSISILPSIYYNDLHFLNETIGFAAGGNGNIRCTTDGGITWDSMQTNFTGDIYTMHFANDLVGWAAGSGDRVLKTTDGGLTWTQKLTPDIISCQRVYSLDADIAFIVGNHDSMGTTRGFLYRTLNGGASWQTQNFTKILSDVYFFSLSIGWVCDIDGGIYQTTDGGSTWTQRDGRANRFTFAGSQRAWSITGSGLIRATDDGWQTYQSQTHAVTTSILWAVSAFDTNNAVASGMNSIIVGTKDGGKTWSEYYNPGSQTYLMDILHKSVDEIWAVGSGGTLVHSTDGGVSWTDSTLSSPWLSGIAFATEDIGCIVSSSGTLYRTSDAGTTWSLHATVSTEPLNRIVFASSNLGWIVADDGVYKSTDIGQTWQLAYAQSGIPLDVAAVGSRVWYTRNNNVVHTTDTGSTWTTTMVFPVGSAMYDIRSLAFADENNGWAASNNGRIYRTTDGGNSWNMETDINGNSLYGIRFANPNRGWAVGQGGAILHFNSLIISTSDYRENELPDRIVLKQNYPNPFNPKTTIRFALPHSTTVALKVFNILGQELKTLFTGKLQAGEFSVEWNAQQFASGVYFYRLQAGSFCKTKKLILLR